MFRHDLYRKAVLESSRETLLGVPFIVNLQCVGGSEIFYSLLDILIYIKLFILFIRIAKLENAENNDYLKSHVPACLPSFMAS